MKLKHNWRLWLAFAMFGALIFLTVQLSSVISRVELEAFTGQWTEKIDAFNIVIDGIDRFVAADDDCDEYDYAEILNPSIQSFDKHKGVFAALYDKDFNLLSTREVQAGENALDPLKNTELIEKIRKSQRDEMRVPYEAANGRYKFMQLYFRWIPTNTNSENRQVAVVAMWPGGIDSHPADMLISWSTSLLALSMVGFVITIIALAPHMKERGNDDA